ncbi:Beta-eliminating lyase [Musa troglodytarum]|uniref:Beta-eliminating lyase n=1 Tax=Musa troglodytarum TaxID=320322 RepID=A0A9E7EQJ9_9LILI|nr:Beta-eliminating lyase [Musa troglodytarum]
MGVKHVVRENDIYLTVCGMQGIHVCFTTLASPGCNLLLPRPGFSSYESAADLASIEVRFYDLVPGRGWEPDLQQLRSLADSATAWLVVINPNNPRGAIYFGAHLQQIDETARDLHIPVIADEIYGHIVFGGSSFVPMASFAHLSPVNTIGSLSNRDRSNPSAPLPFQTSVFDG